jgi:serine/threonine-protein kinase
MAVYDWGDDEVPFMVLELLSGGSLRGILDSGARLSPAQAAHVGRQVTAALEYAHTRGVVHRDIKPANLLFDEHGIVRVADFGIARALAEASWTEPAGTVIGTARYAAPEQGTGAALDGRADLYSLAVVLTEAVTGVVPDIGETAVGTLVARSTKPLVAPAALGRLGPVVERAGRPDPADRYPDAATMREALADAARALPAPQPLPLAGLRGELDAGDPTRIGRALQVFDQDARDALPPEAPVVRERRRRRRAPGSQSLVPIVVGLAVLLALAAAGGAMVLSTTGGSTVSVPSLVGVTTDTATQRASDAGLTLTIEQREADDPRGVVIAQSPEPGAFVHGGSSIHLVVSRGPPPVPVPDVSTQSVDDATTTLQRASLGVNVVHQFSDTVPAGAVIGTDPAAAASAPRDSTVNLLVSDGPTPVTIKDVSNQSYDAAAQAISAQGFAVTRRDDFSDTVPPGSVIGTEPAAGQAVPRGSSVTIVVSKGPEMVTVPGLRGQTLDAATQQLTGLGLTVDANGYHAGATVRAQDPPQGTSVAKGSKVTLFF